MNFFLVLILILSPSSPTSKSTHPLVSEQREVAPALPGRPGGAPKPASFTFKEDRLAEIGRGNLRLMKNLHAIHSGAGGPPGGIAAVVERKGAWP